MNRSAIYEAVVWSFDASTGNVTGAIPQLYGTSPVTIKPQLVRSNEVSLICPVKAGEKIPVFFQGNDDTEPKWLPRVIDQGQTDYYDDRYVGGGGGGEVFRYVHTQGVSATTWNIPHNLGGFPNVTTVDYVGNIIRGDINYIDSNNISVTFLVTFDGKAYLS